MRRIVGWLLGVSAPIVIACGGGSSTPASPHCSAALDGCACDSEVTSSTTPATVACNPDAFPGTFCCADPKWPASATTCSCRTGAIYCGIVPSYFTDGHAGCVCATFPSNAGQAAGATCYPNATTTNDGTIGECCLFATGDCACEAGLHNGCTMGTRVASCSAANFPPPTQTCAAGLTKVARCS